MVLGYWSAFLFNFWNFSLSDILFAQFCPAWRRLGLYRRNQRKSFSFWHLKTLFGSKWINLRASILSWGQTVKFLYLSLGSAGKESACSTGDLDSIPGLGRSPGEGKGYPLQYSGLENSVDCTVHGVIKSQTRLNDFHFT